MAHPTDTANASVREACAQAAYRYIKEREIPGLAWRVRDLIQTIPILTAQPDKRRSEEEIRAVEALEPFEREAGNYDRQRSDAILIEMPIHLRVIRRLAALAADLRKAGEGA